MYVARLGGVRRLPGRLGTISPWAGRSQEHTVGEHTGDRSQRIVLKQNTI